MEEWEKRYKHDLDFMESQCVSLGIPVPVQDEYGVIKGIPKNLWMRYKGKEFWAEFKKRQHTSAEFDRCACKERI